MGPEQVSERKKMRRRGRATGNAPLFNLTSAYLWMTRIKLGKDNADQRNQPDDPHRPCHGHERRCRIALDRLSANKATRDDAVFRAKHLASARRRHMTDPKEFMAKAQAQMEAWTAEMGKMQSKMMDAGAKGQDEMAKQMDALNAQRKHAEAQMEELGKANMDAAKEMQASVQKMWADMESQMKAMQKKFMG
jgi:flagellar biosynthesis regulator FlaF